MRHALLIAATTAGLEAPNRDAACLERCLAPLGFVTTVVQDKAATRKGILTAFENMIASAAEGDKVVFYYSGHGGLMPNPNYRPTARGECWQPPHYQFLVPVDIADSSEGDFRGILDLELIALLARLTKRTQDVVVILDCCHAAGTVRQAGFRAKSLAHPWDCGIGALFERLRQSGLDAKVTLEGNPHAVRLMACGAHELSFEYDIPRQGPISLFTEALTHMLSHDGWQTLSWLQLMQQVRERVQLKKANQRPCLEGPGQRKVFELEPAAVRMTFPVFFHGNLMHREVRIRGGHLHGMAVGDVLELHGTADSDVEDSVLGRLRVEKVTADWSQIIPLGSCAVRQGMWARPCQKAFRKLRVCLQGVPRAVRNQWMRSEVLCFEGDQAMLGEVSFEDGVYRLHSATDLEQVLRDPAEVLATLERMAKAKSFLSLCSGENEEYLSQPFRVDWGRVEGGLLCSLPATQCGFRVGDELYVQIDNTSNAPLYVHIFDVNLDHEIQLLTRADVYGTVVSPATSRTFGYDSRTGRSSWRLSWSMQLTTELSGARAEHLLVVLCGGPVDLSTLASRSRSLGSRTRLAGHLAQMIHACARSLDETPEVIPYAVVHLDMLLDPG